MAKKDLTMCSVVTMIAMSLTAATASAAPYGEFLETFDGFTTPSNIADDSAWYNQGAEADLAKALSGVGVNGTVGVSNADQAIIWTAHAFDPTDLEFGGAVFRMDFQTDASGNLDDDRIGWTTTGDSTSSNNIFGVQLDPGGSGASGYNIETYWDTEAGDSSNFRDSLVALPENLGANAWYQLELAVTMLPSGGVQMDVEFWGLTSAGARDGATPLVSHTIADTNAYGDNKPAAKYFTDTEVFPVYKNYDNTVGNADNAYASIVPEPATLGLLAIGGIALLKKRRH